MKDRGDWLFVALSLAEKHSMSPVQIQKSIFLFSKLLPRRVIGTEFYVFSPDNYGPFSLEIYDDLHVFEADGLVSVDPSPAGNYRLYSLTGAGHKTAKKLGDELPPQVKEYAAAIVDWVMKQTFRSLITAIYQKYPEYKVNSIFA